jgi:hypothetical protein
MKPKISPTFSGQCEIRMGSPFNHAYLKLEGKWVPDLPKDGWQDIYAHSDNGNILALVRWDTENNEPGFRLVMIDTKRKAVEETDRIPGCCESLEWRGAGFSYRAFGYQKPNQASEVTARKLPEPQR